jgi:ABC-type nitrate/sulfonate/bicarbonate transport system substrate-binding protein
MANNRLQSRARDRLRLGTFTPSVALDVARAQGLLATAGLDVVEHAVPSSPAQFSSLAMGELDAVFTSPDNAIAYRFLPGNPLGRLLDVEIVRAVDRGLGLALVLRPGLPAPHRGMRFAVDVPQSGFAFVGYALLDRAGLARGDYEVSALGSTPRRAEALLAGDCDATILNAGNEIRAVAAGATAYGAASELGPYLGSVLARLESAPDPDTVDRFAAVLSDVARGILDGRFAEQAVRSAESVLGLSAELAVRHLAVLTSPDVGLVPDGVVDVASLETLVDLRRRHLPDPALELVDPRALVRAGVLSD